MNDLNRTPSTFPRSVRPFVGQIRSRDVRVVKNARWYLVDHDGVAKVGWGDLSLDDINAVATRLTSTEAFVVLPESPGGGQHPPHAATDRVTGWCWYDRPDCRDVTVADVVESARFAIVSGAVLRVTDEGDDTGAAGHESRGRPPILRADLLDAVAGLAEPNRWIDVLGQCVTGAVAAALVGVAPREIDRLRREHQLLGIRTIQRWVYPTAQFRMADGQIGFIDGLDEVLARLDPSPDGLAAARWMATPNRRLGGLTPWAALGSRRGEVLAAAAEIARAWTGTDY